MCVRHQWILKKIIQEVDDSVPIVHVKPVQVPKHTKSSLLGKQYY